MYKHKYKSEDENIDTLHSKTTRKKQCCKYGDYKFKFMVNCKCEKK